eukprot:14395434-Alexandrium_andersonii.AAC.1
MFGTRQREIRAGTCACTRLHSAASVHTSTGICARSELLRPRHGRKTAVVPGTDVKLPSSPART